MAMTLASRDLSPGPGEADERRQSTTYAPCIPLELFRDGNPSEIRVFCALSSFQGRKSNCQPGYRSISDRSGVRINHIPQYLRSLERKGWIRRVRRGKRRTNVYEIWRPTANWSRGEVHPKEYGDHADSGYLTAEGSDHPSVGCSDHPSVGCSDHPSVGWSSRKRSSRKGAGEKGALRAPGPAPPPPAGQRLTDEEFAALDKQLFIPSGLREHHTRYRQIIRAERLLEKHGPERTQAILSRFAAAARGMRDFDPARGPGLFLKKIRDGEYDLPDRDFAADDREREEADLLGAVRQWLFWLEAPREHEKAQREAGLSWLDPWVYDSLGLAATAAKVIHLAEHGLPEGKPESARKKAEDEFSSSWQAAEQWRKRLITAVYRERVAPAGAGPGRGPGESIVQMLAGVN